MTVGYKVAKVFDIPLLNRRRQWEAPVVPNNFSTREIRSSLQAVPEAETSRLGGEFG